MPELFDSRNTAYRAPFGAVEEGTAVLLRICLPRTPHCSAARLCVEPDGKPIRSFGLFWAGMEGEDHEWWDCHYTPEKAGLYWYWFEMDTDEGPRRLTRRADSRGEWTMGPSDQSACRPAWQLTCYERGFTTPDWLAGGVMYQIFPDRFAASGEPKDNVPAGRVLRSDWGGQPAWKPDEQGRVLNNDYFGGDLKGIERRLDRLKELGVTCLYLNPIFEAHSNHRYDTADYEKIDPLLGTAEDFRSLVETARRLGIRLLLDGVFSHTGADSRYFNRERRYASPGACNTLGSPYASWYTFTRWPDRYQSWWGFDTLPEVNKRDISYSHFINGEEGIARRWLREGAGGWRLDVADELPDEFLDALRRAVKAENPDALILGEVWEDASHKESYGHRRRYLLGEQLDTVMNYPFRDGILHFLTGGGSADFINIVMDIVENYPPQTVRLLMNHIGTHDTERALTILAGEPAGRHGRSWQASHRITSQQRERGLRLMRLASALQFCLPGVPCIYYGDEAGMEGYRDPFNRGCYPWGKEEPGLLRWYRQLGKLRRHCSALAEGAFVPLPTPPETVCFLRKGEDGTELLCAVNRCEGERTVLLPGRWRDATVSMGGGWIEGNTLHLPGLDCGLGVLTEE